MGINSNVIKLPGNEAKETFKQSVIDDLMQLHRIPS